ncbi:DUF6444 domain-containing protein [Candidatus Magnetobacterium casense]|uniref:DUF6444 domain-containing protein n=1 Tax=Candidatus Magnetobacterium casense TaxID=1455061 RepID=UPI00058D306B|nr:DUF6444 domain-containing protein [Candidatus Magnetobacterium casensis]
MQRAGDVHFHGLLSNKGLVYMYHYLCRTTKEKIASLEKNSQNSSKPPSTDGFKGGKDKEQKVNKSKRKAGGQPGHKGSNREMLPPEEVDHIVDIYPERCQCCNEALPQVGTGKVHRKQVTEIPPIEPEVTAISLPFSGM